MTRESTGTTYLGANVIRSEWIERTFVKALRAKLLFTPLGRESTLPENQSKKVRWQFTDSPAAVPSISTEGNDPSSTTDYTTTTAEATLMEWGGYTEFSRFLMKTEVMGLMQEFITGAGYQAAITMDTRCQLQALASATNTNDVGTALTAEDLRVAASELHSLNAEYHPASPGGNFFIFIGTPAALYDMMGEGAPAWFQVKSSDYVSSLTTPFRDTPATAAIYDVICKSSTNVQTASSNDVMYLLAKDAFGVASLDTNVLNPRIIITSPDELVSAPVRNRGTVGWWILFTCTLIDANRVVEILADT